MPRVRFQPLRIQKRDWRPQWQPNPNHQDHYDETEKTALLEEGGQDDSYNSLSSSRMSSASYDFQQTPLIKSRKAQSRQHSAHAYAPQRKCHRWFTVGLATILILFFFLLLQLAFSSAREVERGTRRPDPKPPPWEEFPVLQRYYSGIRTLVAPESNIPEYPTSHEKVVEDVVDALESAADLGRTEVKDKRDEELTSRVSESTTVEIELRNRSNTAPCYLDSRSRVQIPPLQSYQGIPRGFPDSVIGFKNLTRLGDGACFDRYGKYGPYGYGYGQSLGGIGAGQEGDLEGADKVWNDKEEVDYSTVRWADAQRQCIHARFKERQVSDVDDALRAPTTPGVRTAVLIRTDTHHNYGAEDILNLRSVISELSLASGGRYEIHFLIRVLDESLPIWSDEETYQKVLEMSLPAEFHGMGTLWSEKQMSLIYNGLEDSRPGEQIVQSNERGKFMPLQFFAQKHPQFDFFWNWDITVRYTGHLYMLLEESSAWASQQPRKYLWERSGRYYVPSEHGSWDEFNHMVRIRTEHGTKSPDKPRRKFGPTKNDQEHEAHQSEKSVWGPSPPPSERLFNKTDPIPATSFKTDIYTWGTHEPPDLLSFAPIFDPASTGWAPAIDVTGYNLTADDPLPPRRATLGSTLGLSRRLLETMHRETALQRHHMHSAMWPASCALHHGFKAVYVPHPVYVDREWPTDYLAAVFNGGADGAVGGARTSVVSEARVNNFRGTTWGLEGNGEFAGRLWRRWLGFRVEGEGGEDAEVNGEGRMCLPPMLLGPVRDVPMVTERRAE